MAEGPDRRDFLKRTSLLAVTAPFAITATPASGARVPRPASVSDPVADTTTGKVCGRVVDGINVFRGIPYGGDTSGKNRFMPPPKVQPWTGVRDALEWGHVAPQPLAERKAALGRAPAHVYLLTYESVPHGGKFGSVHGTEMPLCYHNLDAWPIAGTGPEARALADRMAGAYVAFARTGRPTVPGVGEWPAYAADARSTMVFDVDTRVVSAPHQELLELVAEHAVPPR